MRNHTTKAVALAAGIFLAVVALSISANASSLRQGSTGSSGAVTGALPGEVLWTYYETLHQPGIVVCSGPGPITVDTTCNTIGNGDNIIRLINPNGGANGNLAGAKPQPVCAMIYVFDDDQEMGECCGCPLTSAQMATFSVEHNLTSNWGLQDVEPTFFEDTLGSIAIVAAAPNAGSCTGQSGACHGGCDPTNVPGYSVTTANNLLGSVTHNQGVLVRLINTTLAAVEFGVTETALSDDAGGDPSNLTYLQAQCGALVGNGTGGGICNCPIE